MPSSGLGPLEYDAQARPGALPGSVSAPAAVLLAHKAGVVTRPHCRGDIRDATGNRPRVCTTVSRLAALLSREVWSASPPVSWSATVARADELRVRHASRRRDATRLPRAATAPPR